MKNIRIFYLEIFPFLVVKFSIYLNRRVFVMAAHRIAIAAIVSNGEDIPKATASFTIYYIHHENMPIYF